MEEEKLHPEDIRDLIKNGYDYVMDGGIRMHARGALMYFNNLINLGVPVEKVAESIQKVTPKGKISLLNEINATKD